MAEFETVRSKVQDFGGAGFVAVERKRVKEEGRGDQEFLMIVRGFYLKDGTARRRNYVTLPDEAAVKQFVAATLAEM